MVNRQHGQTSRNALAAAVGQSPTTVQLALDTITAQGEIVVEYHQNNTITITRTGESPSPDAPAKLAAFQAAVAETAAYRAFFRRATPPYILGEDSTS